MYEIFMEWGIYFVSNEGDRGEMILLLVKMWYYRGKYKVL